MNHAENEDGLEENGVVMYFSAWPTTEILVR